MLGGIVLLTIAYAVGTRAASEGTTKEEVKASPLTEHLLRLVNHFDNNIIGFHLVVPRDDEMAKGFDSKPAPISKILEYVSQINFLRNLIDNDPEVSLKKERSLDERSLPTTPSPDVKGSDSHHTDILIFSQNRPQSFPLQLNPSLDQNTTSFSSTNEQNTAFKGIFSKVNSLKSSSSGRVKSPRAFEPGDLSILNKFEDGIRVFPLISVNTTDKNIDSIKNEGNRFCREIPPDIKIEKLAFLVEPRSSSNPSVLLVPRSISQSGKVSKPYDLENAPLSEEQPRSTNVHKRAASRDNFNIQSPLTFIAPLMDSTLVLPLKSGYEEKNVMNIFSPEEKINGLLSENEKGSVYNSFIESGKKSDIINANLFNSSGGIDRNDANYTPNTSDDYSFAEILRESITDLVNGVDQDSFDSSNFKNSELTSNNRLKDYDVYLSVDDKERSLETIQGTGEEPSMIQSYSQELYSSPKSKLVNRGNNQNRCGFFRLGQLCPNFSLGKRNKNEKSKISNPKERDLLFDINSLYKTKVNEILSHTKNGDYKKKLQRCKRASDVLYKNKKNFATVNSGNKLFVKYDPKRFSLYHHVAGQNNLSSNRDKRGVSQFPLSSTVFPVNTNTFLNVLQQMSKRETLDLDKVENETDLLKKNVSRTNRSPGVVMIPRSSRNFDLLIVYPYGSHNNKKVKTIVSKSVKKINSLNSNKKTKALGSSMFSPRDQFLKHFDFTNLKLSGSPLENSMLNKKDSGPAELKNVVRLIDSFKSDANYEKEDGMGDQVSVRKDFNVIPAALLSFRSSSSNFIDSSSQNLSDVSSSGEKLPAQIPDFNVKLLQGETASPFRSKSLMDTLNISSSASVEALKSSIAQSSENVESNSLALTTESADLLPPNSSEAINSPNFKPFLNTSGFRVSNGSNLLIKLTELKTPLEPKGFDVEDYRVTTESSMTSGMALIQKHFKKPLFFGGKSTKRPFGNFFKSSKKVAFTGASIAEEVKNMKNSTDPTSDCEFSVVNNSQSGNDTCVQNAYTFTEGYDSGTLTNSTVAPSGDRSIVHTTRPWSMVGNSVSTSDETEETTEEIEDSDDGYPDFAPVISVNIFPIVGGWRKPQIEALSLIKDLFKTAQQFKVEEEQLPTYLSELFDASENNKHRTIKTKDNIQKKLDSILSGQVSVNDILKLKLQNILQRSNKPTHAEPIKAQPV